MTKNVCYLENTLMCIRHPKKNKWVDNLFSPWLFSPWLFFLKKKLAWKIFIFVWCCHQFVTCSMPLVAYPGWHLHVLNLILMHIISYLLSQLKTHFLSKYFAHWLFLAEWQCLTLFVRCVRSGTVKQRYLLKNGWNLDDAEVFSLM